jgi:DNA-binding HxlR family transcriptional regulator
MMGNTAADRRTVSASDPSEVRYFASKHGLSSDQVLDLIKQFGNDRKTLESKVASIKGPTPA